MGRFWTNRSISTFTGSSLQRCSRAQGKSLSDLDYQFLAKSEELDRQEVQIALEAARTKEVEARLAEEQKRLKQEQKTAKLQRLFLGFVTFALAISSGIGLVAFWQIDGKFLR